MCDMSAASLEKRSISTPGDCDQLPCQEFLPVDGILAQSKLWRKVKAAENKVIDLDVFPDNRRRDQFAKQTRDAVQGKLPSEEAQGTIANTQGAVAALTGTVGGGLKGIVDTTGNTVGSLAQGLQGTVQGLGDRLSSTVQFAGGVVSTGVGQIDDYVTGGEDKDAESNSSTVIEAGSDEGYVKTDPGSKTERRVLPDRYKDPESDKAEEITEPSEQNPHQKTLLFRKDKTSIMIGGSIGDGKSPSGFAQRDAGASSLKKRVAYGVTARNYSRLAHRTS